MSERATKLRGAKKTYFETGKVLMSDAEYDAEESILRREEPAETFVDEVGEIPQDAVDLPFPMPSLKKVKPDESSFGSFKRKFSKGWVVSDKLDGISALWYKGCLCLRGNDTKGADVTRFVKWIEGLAETDKAIRGEILTLRESGGHRSAVNGALHRKTVNSAEMKAFGLRFVAYQVIDSGMTREQQFEWLVDNGFEVPEWNVLKNFTQESMSAYWKGRRADSVYELDGIVVGVNKVPSKVEFGERYPDDCVAFKMPLPEQCAGTVVRKVQWNCSRQGIYAPRVEIEPVKIGNAVISYVTGHNAKYIVDEGIGPGAEVVIRRSGDVIPIIDYVVKSVKGELPASGTWEWHGVHAKAIEGNGGVDTAVKQMLHYLRCIGVDGVGEASVRTIVEAGVVEIGDLGDIEKEQMQELIGEVNGAKLWNGIREAEGRASEEDIWKGCPYVPAGIGAVRWKSLFTTYPDFEKWMGAKRPEGWNDGLWEKFQESLPQCYTWRKKDMKRIPVRKVSVSVGVAVKKVADKGAIVLTGFRDKELESRAVSSGWSIGTAVSRNTRMVLIPNSEDPATYDSTKVTKARQLGVPVICVKDFVM